MAPTIQYKTPASRHELVAALEAVHAQATALWDRFPAREFYAAPAVGGWSPAQNVAHLVRSTSAVTQALRLPRLILRLLFGASRRPSRTFAELRADYKSALAAGAGAGEYAAPELHPADEAAERQRLLARWRKLLPALRTLILRWDENSLDRYRLPHPILGKLTVREMLYFTVYHIGHHAEIVAKRS
jgi:hypothetical protein